MKNKIKIEFHGILKIIRMTTYLGFWQLSMNYPDGSCIKGNSNDQIGMHLKYQASISGKTFLILAYYELFYFSLLLSKMKGKSFETLLFVLHD